MKVAFEINWCQKVGGMRTVSSNLIREMCSLAPENQYLLFSNNIHQLVNETENLKQYFLTPPALLPDILWDQFLFPHLALPSSLKKHQPDVSVFTSNYVSRNYKLPAVVIIHDMTPFILPETFNWAHTQYQQSYFKWAVKSASHILTVSENSKKDICRFLHVPEEKITVMPLASSSAGTNHYEPLPDEIGRKPFLLYVGGLHPRKNLKRLIQTFKNVIEDTNIEHQLVIVGEKKWMTDEIFTSKAFLKIKNRTILTGRVSENMLHSLYKHCEIFIYPSLYEGFGLPVLEAMSHGAAVISSNNSSIPEVAGDAACLVNPYNVDEMTQATRELINTDASRQQLSLKAKQRSKLFSWKTSAEIALDVINTVMHSKE